MHEGLRQSRRRGWPRSGVALFLLLGCGAAATQTNTQANTDTNTDPSGDTTADPGGDTTADVHFTGPSRIVGPACPTVATLPQLEGRRPDGQTLVLPEARTEEPCDGIDNDGDGFTDPHCGTVPCKSDADCTYGGLLADADCNAFQGTEPGFNGPGCNQIDGFTLDPHKGLNGCWGVLCPAGQKCVSGDCVAPGTKAPCDACTGGSECPAHSGCIPAEVDDGTGELRNAMCVTYCHHLPCPAGFACSTVRLDVETHSSWHRICVPEGTDRCPGMGDMPGDFVTQGPDVCE